MAFNSYVGLAMLSTHPAFSLKTASLVCPLCKEFQTMRTGEYDRHFFAHNPTEEQIANWCSGKTYDRWKAKRARLKE